MIEIVWPTELEIEPVVFFTNWPITDNSMHTIQPIVLLHNL